MHYSLACLLSSTLRGEHTYGLSVVSANLLNQWYVGVFKGLGWKGWLGQGGALGERFFRIVILSHGNRLLNAENM